MSKHIAILGARPGGYVAAIRAAQLGARVTVIETMGFCKIIADTETGQILEAHMVGAHAVDLIHEAALAIQTGAGVTQMAEMTHAHPTMAEGFMEAAEDAEGRAIHQVRRRAGS